MENLPLVLDLVEWVAERPRHYDDVMEAWRTTCPRLSVWEDTVDAGYLAVGFDDRATKIVTITESGTRFLRDNRKAGRRPTA